MNTTQTFAKLGVFTLVGALAFLLVGCGDASQNANNANSVGQDGQAVVAGNDDSAPAPQAQAAGQEGDAVARGVAIRANYNEADLAELASCLTNANVTMYGTDRCPHCQTQKAMFGDAFATVNYVDCDEDARACGLAGVRGYPTWTNEAGDPFPGTQTLENLAEISGCSIEQSA